MEANLIHNTDMARKLGVTAICAALTLGASSCGSGKNQIPGIPTFTVGVANNTLTASFVATDLKTSLGISTPIPDLTGATASIGPYLSTSSSGSEIQGTIFTFDVDLNTLAASTATEAGLPDGRPLPDVTSGELPRWSFQIGGETIYVYLADEAFAIFVPIQLESDGVTLGTTISASFTDDHGNVVGKMYAIPAVSSGNSSGLLVLVPFPGQSGVTTNLTSPVKSLGLSSDRGARTIS
jgi:hypothetical protein